MSEKIYWPYAPHELSVIDRMTEPVVDETFVDKLDMNRAFYCRHGEYSWVAARVPDNAKCVDVGCGDSQFPAYLAAIKRCQSHAIDLYDYSKVQAAHAARWNSSVAFMQTDGGALGGRAFDAATCISSLEHSADMRGAAAKARKIVRAGGVVLYTVPFSSTGHRFAGGTHFISVREIAPWLAGEDGELVELDFITHSPTMPSYEFCNATRAAVALVSVRIREGAA